MKTRRITESAVRENLFSKSSGAYEDKFLLFAVVYPAFAAFLSGISGCKNLKVRVYLANNVYEC
jgi:hypothetical protein